MDIRLQQTFEKSSNFLDSPFEYRLKTRTFANNTIDMLVTKIKHRIEKQQEPQGGLYITIHPKTLTDEIKEAKRLENLERAVRRARQAVHYACRQINADHMLTLTTRIPITAKEQFFDIYTKFVRLVREKDLVGQVGQFKLVTRKIKRDWLYVGVPELQERGAYHMHVACAGKQDLDLLRSCWYVALGGTPDDVTSSVLGQIDVQNNKRRFSGMTEVHKTFSLVRYLTKYISKGFEQSSQLGEHRYKVSRTAGKPNVQVQNLIACFSNGGQGFVDAIKEVLSIADFIGVCSDYELWNRGDDIFILRGRLSV